MAKWNMVVGIVFGGNYKYVCWDILVQRTYCGIVVGILVLCAIPILSDHYYFMYLGIHLISTKRMHNYFKEYHSAKRILYLSAQLTKPGTSYPCG